MQGTSRVPHDSLKAILSNDARSVVHALLVVRLLRDQVGDGGVRGEGDAGRRPRAPPRSAMGRKSSPMLAAPPTPCSVTAGADLPHDNPACLLY